MRNEYKKTTFEDKFAREYYCSHARLNSVRRDKKEQHKSFRRNSKKIIDKELYLQYNIDIVKERRK